MSHTPDRPAEGESLYDDVMLSREFARITAAANGKHGPQVIGDTGRWHVFTEASGYLIDRGAATLLRNPGAGDGSDPDVSDPVAVSALRLDDTSIPLLAVELCAVGEPAVFLLQIRADGVPTMRRTSVVRRIVALDEPPAA